QASAYLPNRAGESPTPEEEVARIPRGALDPSPGTGRSQPGLFRPVRLDGRRRLVARGEPGRASAGGTRGGGRRAGGGGGEQVGRPDTRGRAGRPVGVVEENGDVVGIFIGGGEVGPAVAVEVAPGQAGGGRPRDVADVEVPEGAVAAAAVHAHRGARDRGQVG